MFHSPSRKLSLLDSGRLTRADLRRILDDLVAAGWQELRLRGRPHAYPLAASLSKNIQRSIEGGLATDISVPDLKKAIRAAARIGGRDLLGPSSLNGWDKRKISDYARNDRYWTQRVIGEMRAAIGGLSDRVRISEAIERALLHRPDLLVGIAGYRSVATVFCEGNMLKAFRLTSAVCRANSRNFSALGWGLQFNGTTREFDLLSDLMSEEFEDIARSRFHGITGYKRFAEDPLCGGNMLKAFQLVSAVCRAQGLNFKALGWEASFNGSTDDFDALSHVLREEISDPSRDRYRGVAGYKRFANEPLCGGSMMKAFLLVRAICKANRLDFNLLGWGAQFNGTTEEFDALAARLKEELEGVPREYRGILGYKRFAEEPLCAGSMLKAIQLVKVVCAANGLNFKVLGWEGQFPGTTEEFDSLSAIMRAEFSHIGESRYRGVVGYKRFADESVCGGNMLKAFLMVSAVCRANQLDFQALEWGGQFNGTTAEFEALAEKMKEEYKDIARSRYRGIAGYQRFADEPLCNGSMLKAFQLVSAVCRAHHLNFAALGWGSAVHATTNEWAEAAEINEARSEKTDRKSQERAIGPLGSPKAPSRNPPLTHRGAGF